MAVLLQCLNLKIQSYGLLICRVEPVGTALLTGFDSPGPALFFSDREIAHASVSPN